MKGKVKQPADGEAAASYSEDLAKAVNEGGDTDGDETASPRTFRAREETPTPGFALGANAAVTLS